MKSDCCRIVLAAATAVVSLPFAASCEKKPEPPQAVQGGTNAGSKSDNHDHDHDHDHDHGHGPTTELGEAAVAGFIVKASREGDVKPGSDTAFDVHVSGTTPAAVRLWVGTQEGRGSMKSRADAEDGGWHAHVEIPSPLPEGAKLWVEVETASAEKVLASFDLRM